MVFIYLILAFSILLSIISIPASLILILILILIFVQNKNLSIIFYSVIFSLVLAMYSSSKIPVSDLSNYYTIFHNLKNLSINDIFSYSYLSIKSTEFIFNLYVYFLSNIFESQKSFTFFSVFIIYTSIIYFSFSLIENKDKLSSILLIIIICFLCVTFSNVSHLIRQYLSISVFFLGYSFYLKGFKTSAIICIVSSIFIHNSTIILLPIFILSFYTNIFSIKILYIFFIILGAELLSNITPVFLSNYESILTINDGSVSNILIILDSLILYISYYLIKKQSYLVENKNITRFYSFVFFILCFMIIFKDIKIIFLRFYIIFDFIRFILIYYIVDLSIKQKLHGLFIIAFLSIIIFLIRLFYSPWYYNPNTFIHISLINLVS